MSSDPRTIPLALRMAATILAGALWFAFIVLYLAFYAGNLDVWQKAAVFLASGTLVGAIVAVFWVTYGFKALETSKKPLSPTGDSG
jgi:membrane protein DedA with SNARE-associated domain